MSSSLYFPKENKATVSEEIFLEVEEVEILLQYLAI